MAVLHSWPLASGLGSLARLDNHDAELDTWIVAWVAHILPRAPLSLFEAPLFYPEHHSLAFSEHMLVPSLMGAPLLWAGLSPVFVYNVLIIAGFALSGWAMYLVMERWTGSRWAGVIAGLVYAFNAHVLTRFVHLQAQHVEFFPIMLFALDRVLAVGKPRHIVLLAAAFVLQALCSNYMLVFCVYALVIAVIVRWPESGRSPAFRLAIAGAISVIALAPFLWPYYQVDQEYHLARPLDAVTQYNAGWRDYLVTGGRLHYAWWSHQFYENRTALFPGFTAAMLAVIAVISGRWRPSTSSGRPEPVEGRDPRVRMALAIGALGVAFSLGTSLPGFRFFYEFFPLFNGLRNVARWGWLLLAAVAILAGFGVAALERMQLRSWRWLPVALCLLITVESIRTPVGFTPYQGIPRIYDRLAAESHAIVAEFPFYGGASVSLNGPYVFANTRYFKPLLNGYSSFHPESFMTRARALNSFPSEAAMAELRVAHVTHLLVHTQQFERRYGRAALDAIDTVSQLEPIADENGIRLYRLK